MKFSALAGKPFSAGSYIDKKANKSLNAAYTVTTTEDIIQTLANANAIAIDVDIKSSGNTTYMDIARGLELFIENPSMQCHMIVSDAGVFELCKVPVGDTGVLCNYEVRYDYTSVCNVRHPLGKIDGTTHPIMKIRSSNFANYNILVYIVDGAVPTFVEDFKENMELISANIEATVVQELSTNINDVNLNIQQSAVAKKASLFQSFSALKTGAQPFSATIVASFPSLATRGFDKSEVATYNALRVEFQAAFANADSIASEIKRVVTESQAQTVYKAAKTLNSSPSMQKVSSLLESLSTAAAMGSTVTINLSRTLELVRLAVCLANPVKRRMLECRQFWTPMTERYFLMRVLHMSAFANFKLKNEFSFLTDHKNNVAVALNKGVIGKQALRIIDTRFDSDNATEEDKRMFDLALQRSYVVSYMKAQKILGNGDRIKEALFNRGHEQAPKVEYHVPHDPKKTKSENFDDLSKLSTASLPAALSGLMYSHMTPKKSIVFKFTKDAVEQNKLAPGMSLTIFNSRAGSFLIHAAPDKVYNILGLSGYLGLPLDLMPKTLTEFLAFPMAKTVEQIAMITTVSPKTLDELATALNIPFKADSLKEEVKDYLFPAKIKGSSVFCIHKKGFKASYTIEESKQVVEAVNDFVKHKDYKQYLAEIKQTCLLLGSVLELESPTGTYLSEAVTEFRRSGTYFPPTVKKILFHSDCVQLFFSQEAEQSFKETLVRSWSDAQFFSIPELIRICYAKTSFEEIKGYFKAVLVLVYALDSTKNSILVYAASE